MNKATNYRIVASTNTCYYPENQLFVQRSQHIRTENPLHKQSEKASKRDVLELAIIRFVNNNTYILHFP